MHTWTHMLFNTSGTSSTFCTLAAANRGDKQVIRRNITGQFVWTLIISCVWPISHMCGQHWGRHGDGRKGWQALISASSGLCYCSRASQMSATWLILLLTDSLLFFFPPPKPNQCAARATAAISRDGRKLTSAWWKTQKQRMFISFFRENYDMLLNWLTSIYILTEGREKRCRGCASVCDNLVTWEIVFFR